MILFVCLIFIPGRIDKEKLCLLAYLYILNVNVSLSFKGWSAARMQQTTYKQGVISDSIWDEKFSKTDISLTPNDGGLTECGVICSVRGNNCALIRFDMSTGRI